MREAAVSQQPHRSRGKGARRRIRLVMMIILCVGVWAGVNTLKQAEIVRGKMTFLADLEEKLVVAKENNEKLKLEITRLNDPEYIEQIAKKEHQMVRPGETLFTEPDPEE